MTPTLEEGTFIIRVGDYFFLPDVVTVTVGTTVIWRAVGDLQHTIVTHFEPHVWGTGYTAGAGSRDFTFTFDKPGAYFYQCDYHPGAMDAWLYVVEES